MTTPRYRQGCTAGSEVSGIALAPSGYAWNVNLDNGNSNRNNQSNHNHVRAVRAGECHGGVNFQSLYSAWREARRGKKPSADQLAFDCSLTDRLIELEQQINTCTWRPAPPTCFVQLAPKAREIHAPAFVDRVVNHWAVPVLEAIYEPTFIYDSYSNRRGKGTHAAVQRLRSFVRQVHSGQSGGYYLQLDIRNFFNSINRRLLYGMLKPRMERAGVPEPLRRVVHALLTYSIARTGVISACTETERAAVPPYKRLENAAPGCGIAIGNLSSQFFATRRDGLPYASQSRVDDAGVAVYFIHKRKPMCFACDRWKRVEDNMRAIAHTISALRGIERWGSGSMVEQAFTGFVALPAPTAWWQTLELSGPDVSKDDIQRAWRALASKHHPDNGGDTSKMADINRARDLGLDATAT